MVSDEQLNTGGLVYRGDPMTKEEMGILVNGIFPPVNVPKHRDEVANWSLEQKFTRVFELTLPKLSGALYTEFAKLLNPYVLAFIVGTLVVWIGSHAVFGAGLVVDCIGALFFCAGVIGTGADLKMAANEFANFIRCSAFATNRQTLEQGSKNLASFVGLVGVGVLLALITRKIKPVDRVDPSSLPPSKKLPPPALKEGVTPQRAALATRAGVAATSMIAQHAKKAGQLLRDARIISEVAKSQSAIIMVRFTNTKSMDWLRRGFPAKPLGINANTDSVTGIVTCAEPKHLDEAFRQGLYVVGDDLVPVNRLGKPIRISAIDWPIQPGQIIDSKTLKPLVGDYDLYSVVPTHSLGQNVSTMTKQLGQSNLLTNKVIKMVNDRIGFDRMMHGAADAYTDSLAKAFKKAGDGVIVYLPDGSTKLLYGLGEAQAFFKNSLGGRQGRLGEYWRPSLAQAKEIVSRQSPEMAAKFEVLFD